MYCQECGITIRARAKFCNKCGTKVRQRFDSTDPASGTAKKDVVPVTTVPPPPPPAPPPAERPLDQPSFAEHSWPGAEEAIVMPVIGKPPPPAAPQLPEVARKVRIPDTDDPQEMLTRFDIQRPPTTGSSRAPDTGEIERAVTERKLRQREYKPFFTQMGDAVPNRQHNRVVMVVPLLLIVSVLLFLFAYIASK